MTTPTIFPSLTLPLPFYYTGLTCVWVYFRVDQTVVTRYLSEAFPESGVEPAALTDGAVAAINFQRYVSKGANFCAPVAEVEFNVIATPLAWKTRAPSLSLEAFLRGDDATKTIGGYRLYVTCDNDLAIKAGRENFGENKFPATFKYEIPDVNSPTVRAWNVECLHDQQKIFSLSIGDLGPLSSTTANASEIVQYSIRDRRPVCSRWTIFGTLQTYVPPPEVTLELGDSQHPMSAALKRVLARPSVLAVQQYAAPPIGSVGRPFYVDG